MKPVFKCDYCDFMGTEEQVKEHEVKCFYNYDRKSCYTCKHKSYKNMKQYNCSQGVEMHENKIWEFCPKYEREEKRNLESFSDIFGGLFGVGI